jgi:hypothetical protein
MEIEKPKVQQSDEPNKPTELMILINHIFNRTEEGKRLLAVLKDIYISNKYRAFTFPANMEMVLKQYGSVEVYAGYREGQRGVIFWLESMIDAYKKLESN